MLIDYTALLHRKSTMGIVTLVTLSRGFELFRPSRGVLPTDLERALPNSRSTKVS